MSVTIEYANYFDRLVQEFNINTDDMRTALGHCGGIYEDTSYLLTKLIQAPQIERVVEFGSGLSTLILAKACEDLGKVLVSFEDSPEWAPIADAALARLNLQSRVVATHSEPGRCPSFGDTQFQLAWVDGSVFGYPDALAGGNVDPEFLGRGGACLYYRQNLEDAILVFDDAQGRKARIQAVLPKLGRSFEETLWFNPCGRGDRHQAISLPENNQEIYKEIIQEVASL